MLLSILIQSLGDFSWPFCASASTWVSSFVVAAVEAVVVAESTQKQQLCHIRDKNLIYHSTLFLCMTFRSKRFFKSLKRFAFLKEFYLDLFLRKFDIKWVIAAFFTLTEYYRHFNCTSKKYFLITFATLGEAEWWSCCSCSSNSRCSMISLEKNKKKLFKKV